MYSFYMASQQYQQVILANGERMGVKKKIVIIEVVSMRVEDWVFSVGLFTLLLGNASNDYPVRFAILMT